MKVKVSEATNLQLDWMVAKCEGVDGEAARLFHDEGHYNYSTDWSQGGPLIEREEISVIVDRDRVFDAEEPVERWYATLPMICDAEYTEYGPTPLIAAMRCFVVSRLGDEVEVPDELA